MKAQEVILQAMRRDYAEEGGFRSLFDPRRGQPEPKRVSVAVVERVSELYRETYFDRKNLRHFQEKPLVRPDSR